MKIMRAMNGAPNILNFEKAIRDPSGKSKNVAFVIEHFANDDFR